MGHTQEAPSQNLLLSFAPQHCVTHTPLLFLQLAFRRAWPGPRSRAAQAEKVSIDARGVCDPQPPSWLPSLGCAWVQNNKPLKCERAGTAGYKPHSRVSLQVSWRAPCGAVAVKHSRARALEALLRTLLILFTDSKMMIRHFLLSSP
jgi:hypothetical protein